MKNSIETKLYQDSTGIWIFGIQANNVLISTFYSMPSESVNDFMMRIGLEVMDITIKYANKF